MMASISLCIICKDEEKSLPILLSVTNKYCEQTIVVDTGSIDNTKVVATELGAEVYDFEWCDDFSAARNYSFSMAKCDYIMWMDAHDVITDNFMQEIITAINNGYKTITANYFTAFDEKDNPTNCTDRTRVARKDLNPIWRGIIHEGMYCDTSSNIRINESVYHRPLPKPDESIKPNYLNMLIKNAEMYPDDARALFYLGREYYFHGRHADCIKPFEQCFEKTLNWNDQKFWALIYISRAYMYLSVFDKARQRCYQAMELVKYWPDGPFTMGQICYYEKKWREAIYWFTKARTMPEPQTLFMKDKTVYSYQASLKYLPVCYDQIGDYESAFVESYIAYTNCPNHPMAKQNYNYFKNKVNINKKILCIYLDKKIKNIKYVIYSYLYLIDEVIIFDRNGNNELINLIDDVKLKYIKTNDNLDTCFNSICKDSGTSTIFTINDIYINDEINFDKIDDDFAVLSEKNKYPVYIKKPCDFYFSNSNLNKKNIFNFSVKNADEKTLGIYLPGSLGDIIMTLNFISQLRNEYSKIDYFCNYMMKTILNKFIDYTKIVDNMYPMQLFNKTDYDNIWICSGYPISEGYPYKPMSKHILNYHADHLGIEFSYDYFILKKEKNIIDFKNYITIQNKAGWSPYKEWNKWEELIIEIKNKYDYKIVQIGGMGDPEIKGVDLRLNHLDFFDMLIVQSHAICHIGIDSVFNHTTNICWDGEKTKSIILFGSTQASASGYPHNSNISLGLSCQPCFREYPNMTVSPIDPPICPNPIGQTIEKPLHACMQGITVDMVIKQMSNFQQQT
jgi:glycosyltransferase involved in cell wall biosynthesis/ADP-heptose:LPS heptosyltransferase